MQELRAIPDTPPGTSPWVWVVPTLVVCASAAAFGAWLLISGRRGPSRSPNPWRLTRWRDRRAYSTRVSLGAAILATAYHAAAWVAPAHWLPFRVPVERWYLVVVPAIILVGAALWREHGGAESGRRGEEGTARG